MTVKMVGLDGLDHLGIDEFNNLYWKGEKIVTVTMIDLPTWVDTAVGFGGWAAVVVAVLMALNYLELKPRWPWSRSSREGGQT